MRKGTNKDINGDGYADLVTGAYNRNSAAGAVYIFHSAGSSGVTITAAASATTTIVGSAASDQFGNSVATGDMNGDGYADVIVGARNRNGTAGVAYIFHSAGSSGVTITAAGSASTIISGTAASDQFGYSVAAGDINGDGYADMIVGAYTRNAGAGVSQGVAYIFHSAGSSGVTITAAASATTIIAGTSASDAFGGSVATGDVNGDGYADVIVGAYGRSSAMGAAYIFHSTGSSGVTITAAASATTIIAGTSASDAFGGSVATGDVNGDGYADVIVGARGFSAGSNQGRGYIFH